MTKNNELKTTETNAKATKKATVEKATKKAKNEKPQVEKASVEKPIEKAIFTSEAKFFESIVDYKYRGEGEIFNFDKMTNLKQLNGLNGKPSPRWYIATNEHGKMIIIELKTNHKKQRVAYLYPLIIDGDKVAFEGGNYDQKEVAYFVIQGAITYLIEQKAKQTKKAK